MSSFAASLLVRWVGRADFGALADAVLAAPDDDAPRLILADWLRDHGDDPAADAVARAAGVIDGWLAMAWYERVTGRPAAGDLPHLTSLFNCPGPDASPLAGTLNAVRRAAVGMIFHRARPDRRR